jgi:hypothetical protein
MRLWFQAARALFYSVPGGTMDLFSGGPHAVRSLAVGLASLGVALRRRGSARSVRDLPTVEGVTMFYTFRNSTLAAVVAGLGLLAAGGAKASLITYEFTATGTTNSARSAMTAAASCPGGRFYRGIADQLKLLLERGDLYA